MQGLGLFTLEEPMLTQRGQLITQGPSTYKIPGFGDCPKQMNVHLLRSNPHERAIYSSKVSFLRNSCKFVIKSKVKMILKL